MEEKQDQAQTTPQSSQKKQGFLSKWLNSLLGRPVASTQQIQVEPNAEEKNKTPEDDSVHEDIEKLKNFAHVLQDKVSPVAQSGKKKAGEAVSSASKVVDTSLLRKLVSILMIMVFFGVAVFIASRFFHAVVNVDETNNNEVEVVVSPTGFEYQPTNPSVWAEDPQVKLLEQDVSTLEREVSNPIIKETQLNPPVLDFNVSF
jgi:hypothetical protein